jgi:hypothetical protein
MRVEGPNRIGQGAQTARRNQTGSGFSLPETESRAPAQRPSGMVNVAGLDTLLALQSVDMPAERRKKAVQRGKTMLDLLDSMKLGVLDGSLSPEMLESLSTAVSQREPTDDPALEGIMAEIELRAEVELAKLKRRAG